MQKPQRPKQLAQNIPPSYPTQKAPLVDQAALFERLDPEALFFAFYFQVRASCIARHSRPPRLARVGLRPRVGRLLAQVGTYQQYLAAKELKRQSWRFHMLHQAWFQRHDCPVEVRARSCHCPAHLAPPWPLTSASPLRRSRTITSAVHTSISTITSTGTTLPRAAGATASSKTSRSSTQPWRTSSSAGCSVPLRRA